MRSTLRPQLTIVYPQGNLTVEALKGIELAASLGAKTSTTYGISIAEEVIRYAKKNNITRVIVGRSRRPAWYELIFGSMVNQLVSISSDFDLMIINSPLESKEIQEEGKAEEKKKESEEIFDHKKLRPYFFCTWMVISFTIIDMLLQSFLQTTNLVMIYLIGVVIAAVLWNIRLAIFTALASGIVVDFFFIPPYLNFSLTDSQYLITMATFVFIGVVISMLVIRSKNYATAAQRRSDYTSSQYSLSLDLVTATTIATVMDIMERHITMVCQCGSVHFLSRDGDLKLIRASRGFKIDDKEIAAARWTFRNGISAGKGTDTLLISGP